MTLTSPVTLGRHGATRDARNRLMFGPHETNLARRREISDRHVSYYQRRAVGGAGVVVTETASVHPSDWPYERAPLATDCAEGWAAVARACHDDGVLVVAALGHAGGQGSSAYSQAPLWAPSPVPDVATRETPKEMEHDDIAAVVEGFAHATRLAVAAGCDGVEVNAGQFSLVRQFLSGLTNLRTDAYGEDRLRFAREVLAAVRAAAGDAVVGLRLSCDELAPWAGITPVMSVEMAGSLEEHLDYVVAVRGSIYTAWATRPDGHVPPGFNLPLAQALRTALPADLPVVAQGSIVDPAMAEQALEHADLVEMTRAQIADPDLGAKVTAGIAEQVRPCILCNQACQVRDARNPIVSCVGEPSSGHEWEDPPVGVATSAPAEVLVVGAGPAGLEAARVAALAGHTVHLVERATRTGGMLRTAAAGGGRERLAALVDWLDAECRRVGVRIDTGTEATAESVAAHDGPVLLCTGSRPGARRYEVADDATVVDADDLLAGADLPDGPVAVWDPIGGPIGISVTESLAAQGREVSFLTPDLIVGQQLSRTGDLAVAHTRLHQAGVALEKRSVLRRVDAATVTVSDTFTGEPREVKAAVVVDAGYRRPDDTLWQADESRPRAGDAVSPRSVYEAVLEGRRLALGLAP